MLEHNDTLRQCARPAVQLGSTAVLSCCRVLSVRALQDVTMIGLCSPLRCLNEAAQGVGSLYFVGTSALFSEFLLLFAGRYGECLSMVLCVCAWQVMTLAGEVLRGVHLSQLILRRGRQSSRTAGGGWWGAGAVVIISCMHAVLRRVVRTGSGQPIQHPVCWPDLCQHLHSVWHRTDYLGLGECVCLSLFGV